MSESIDGCPYRSCEMPHDPTETGAKCENRPAGKNPEGPVAECYVCKHSGRIVHSCPNCSTRNQFLAKFCRSCGGFLSAKETEGLGLGGWRKWIRTPVSSDDLSVPGMLAAGDMLMSYEGSAFIVRRLSDGEPIDKIELTERLSFFSSPVLIREKVYILGQECIWAYSLVTGDRQRHLLEGLTFLEDAAATEVITDRGTCLVAAGRHSMVSLLPAAHSVHVSTRGVEMSEEDDLRSPVSLADGRVLFTSRNGRIWIAALEGEAGSLGLRIRAQEHLEDYLLSAPAYGGAGNVAYFECVRQSDLKRHMGVLRFSEPLLIDILPLGPDEETFEQESRDLDLLRFAPVLCGAFAVTWSLLMPHACHVVGPGGSKRFEVEGLDLDRVGMACHSGRIVTVKGGRLQSFPLSDGGGRVDPRPLRQLPDELGDVLGRPVVHMGMLMVQQQRMITCLEV
jgi:hypothetical protein